MHVSPQGANYQEPQINTAVFEVFSCTEVLAMGDFFIYRLE